MLKKVMYIVIVNLIGLFGYQIIKAKKTANIEKKCDSTMVTYGEVEKTIKVNATLKSSNYADISTEIPTLIKWIGVEVNDEVKKDERLIVLDKGTITAQIKNLKLAVERAELAEQEARLKSKHLSGKQILSLKKASEQARQNLNQVYAQAKKTTIRSPIDGVVIKKNANTGEVASGVLLRIIDTNSMQIEALIPEVDVAKVHEGQEVTVVFDAYLENEQKGIVKRLEIGSSELQGNTYYKAIIEISNPQNLVLLEGMNAEVAIRYENKKDVLVVQRDFAKKDENGYFVHNEVEGKKQSSLKKIYFKEGLVGDKNIEIISGLSERQVLSKNCNK